jgi:hypothetical protein
MTISKIKNHLYDLKFLLSKIKNIRYVGQTTVEFIVLGSYCSRFIERFKEYSTHFTIIPDYNHIKNPWESETTDYESHAKIKRVTQKILRDSKKSNDSLVRDFFRNLIKSLGPIATKELLRLENNIDRTEAMRPLISKDPISTIGQGQMAQCSEEVFSTKTSSNTSLEVKTYETNELYFINEKNMNKLNDTRINSQTSSDSANELTDDASTDNFQVELLNKQVGLLSKRSRIRNGDNANLERGENVNVGRGENSSQKDVFSEGLRTPGSKVVISTMTQGQMAMQDGENFSTKSSPPPSSEVIGNNESNNTIYLTQLCGVDVLEVNCTPLEKVMSEDVINKEDQTKYV